MCGIFGFAGDPGRALALDESAALRSLRHRGPDGEGTFHDLPSPSGGAAAVGCVLAHRRLAIIDRSEAGAQPMASEDGRYTIVYNGEVYNFRELRAELRALGPSRWRSESDTEVVLRAFAELGPGCVRRFRGMFAFAIWDREERSLFLARDAVGVKPLYYALTAEGLAFASEVRTLLAAGVANRRLDREALSGYLAFGSVQGPRTIVEDVRSLPPGFTASFRDGRLSASRYWSLPRPGEIREASGPESIRAALADAVAGTLISDVPVGVFLSGGIDSTAIAALASASPAPIRTFTVTFDGEADDEGALASDVARRFGCVHRSVALSGARAVDEIEDAVAALDQPSADGVNTWFVAKAAREAGLSVALSGLGGDEVFAGYRGFRRFAALRWGARALRAAPSLSSGAFDGMPQRNRRIRALVAARGDAARSYAVLRGMFLRAERNALVGAPPAAAPVDDDELLSDACRDAGPDEERDAVNLYSRLEISNYLPNTLLRDTDAMSMAHSLEVRVPFLDRRLVEEVYAVPGIRKIRGRGNKPLLRAAVPEIPAEIVGRAKTGFALPFDGWFRDGMRGRVEEMLSAGVGRVPELLDRDAVGRLWKSFLRGPRFVSWSRVWCVAVLSSWCERNDVAFG